MAIDTPQKQLEQSIAQLQADVKNFEREVEERRRLLSQFVQGNLSSRELLKAATEAEIALVPGQEIIAELYSSLDQTDVMLREIQERQGLLNSYTMTLSNIFDQIPDDRIDERIPKLQKLAKDYKELYKAIQEKENPTSEQIEGWVTTMKSLWVQATEQANSPAFQFASLVFETYDRLCAERVLHIKYMRQWLSEVQARINEFETELAIHRGIQPAPGKATPPPSAKQAAQSSTTEDVIIERDVPTRAEIDALIYVLHAIQPSTNAYNYEKLYGLEVSKCITKLVQLRDTAPLIKPHSHPAIIVRPPNVWGILGSILALLALIGIAGALWYFVPRQQATDDRQTGQIAEIQLTLTALIVVPPPTHELTGEPTAEPTEALIEEPTAEPTEALIEEPTAKPTARPTETPTPTVTPTSMPEISVTVNVTINATAYNEPAKVGQGIEVPIGVYKLVGRALDQTTPQTPSGPAIWYQIEYPNNSGSYVWLYWDQIEVIWVKIGDGATRNVTRQTAEAEGLPPLQTGSTPTPSPTAKP